MDAMVTNAQTRTPASSFAEDDRWTLAAFGVLAYMISNVLHEGLGHGGVAWLSGARHITVTSTYMDAGFDTRWILAAGTLVNLVFGVLGLAMLRSMRRADVSLRLFLWSFTAFNLLLGTGYFLFSGIGGIGDWAEWMKGLSPVWAWRVGFALLGAVSYFGAALLLARELVQMAGSNETRHSAHDMDDLLRRRTDGVPGGRVEPDGLEAGADLGGRFFVWRCVGAVVDPECCLAMQ